MDPRIERTKAALRQAIEELSAEKDFEKVTVREICERAGLSRSAFYGNYHDKFDLARDAIQSAVAASETDARGKFEESLISVLESIEENRVIRNSIAVRGLDNEARCVLDDLFDKEVRGMISKGTWRQRDIRVSLDSTLAFVSQGLAGPIGSWVRKGCGQDKREVAREMVLLVSNIFEIG